MKKTLLKKMILAAGILTATVVAAQVYKGVRVPQMNGASDRDNIEVNGTVNPLAAGQLIFNTENGQLEYFDGQYWVSMGSDSVFAEFFSNDSMLQVLIDSLLKNTNALDTLYSELLANTNLRDTIFDYLTTDPVVREMRDSIFNTVKGLNGLTIGNIAGDTIAIGLPTGTANQLLMWDDGAWKAADPSEIAIEGDGLGVAFATGLNGVTTTVMPSVQDAKKDSLIISLPAGGATGQVLKWTETAPSSGVFAWQAGDEDNTVYTAGTGIDITSGVISSTVTDNNTTYTVSTNESVRGDITLTPSTGAAQNIKINVNDPDSVIGNEVSDTIAGRGGLTLEGAGTAVSPLKVGLVAGTAPDQILKWNNTTNKWELATAASVIKTVTLTSGASYTTESVFFTGATAATDDATVPQVIGIEPVITSPQGDVFIGENLDISTTAKAVGNTIAWTVRIKSENINPGEGFTLTEVKISYISSGTIEDGTVPAGTLFVGQ